MNSYVRESEASRVVFSRAYYSASIAAFTQSTAEEVLGKLTAASEFSVDTTQRDAWVGQISLLQGLLVQYSQRGDIYFEFVVPRLGKRIDVVLIIDQALFLIEFKVGESEFNRSAVDQVWDYALDLKNFHESSHGLTIAPILVATNAGRAVTTAKGLPHADGVMAPVLATPANLVAALESVLANQPGPIIARETWEQGRYKPTPTIVEAATALYSGHSVSQISRNDAGATNLSRTSARVSDVIERAKAEKFKAICLVTGVPGAGKTLVGLDIATKYMDAKQDLHSVYLSGNGPLVDILREALARNQAEKNIQQGLKAGKGMARQAVKAFIQPVHHFRDECLKDPRPPVDHVAIFDEAQRAWNREKTADFMRRKKGKPDFDVSEPEFLISCLDRHPDWAVVVCLIGGGQEINSGEGGIAEWVNALISSFPDWRIHISPRLQDDEYATGDALTALADRKQVHFEEDLHLAVSMRSFRAENLSCFVKKALDLEAQGAASAYAAFRDVYPVCLTRDVSRAKKWLRQKARGSERYGVIVSSQAQRLKPHAIDVRVQTDPVHWFLNGKEDVRSSYYLEDVATEFQVQGLELDWACLVWDADFRYSREGWQHYSFVGERWQHIRKDERKSYLKNAYRVLLTRARQGMVIAIPEGDPEDDTRRAEFYDSTFDYLKGLGLQLI